MDIRNFFRKNNIDCLVIRDHIIRLGNNDLYGNVESELTSIIYNKSTVMIVIEDMSLGILLNKHHACQLPYIANQFKNNTLQKSVKLFSKLTHSFLASTEVNDSNRILVSDDNLGCRQVKIDTEWDTTQWNYVQLCSLPKWIDSLVNQQINTSQITSQYQQTEFLAALDLNFLQAMGIMIDTQQFESHSEN